MRREDSIHFLNTHDITWDVIVIGGGATGLGAAMDASLRGYKTILFEQSDFTKGTSSRSTKLVHGGVRYLANGNISLVLEALKERGLLLQNAPHLSSNQSFLIPTYSWWETAMYTAGLKLYDLMAGKLSLGKSELWGSKSVKNAMSTINDTQLKGGVLYHDGQFDDTRLGINIAQTCTEHGAHVLNYFKVNTLQKNKNGHINGVEVTDLESSIKYHVKGRVVINATGVFVDNILQMDSKDAPALVSPSQGTHIVLDRSFMPTEHALMIPKTSDGRVLFAVPWHDKIVVGTTDTVREHIDLEPLPLSEEVDFILNTFNLYVNQKATRSDVLSVFCGLRPLVKPQSGSGKTKDISRSHKLMASESGLVTITGGKWTTFRKMAEDTIDLAIKIGQLSSQPCPTKHFPIHGYSINTGDHSWLRWYGSDVVPIKAMMKNEPELYELIHPKYPFTKAAVAWAVRQEMARTVEDVLARRIRILFLDAKAAIEMAPIVAAVMSKELKQDEAWVKKQITEFEKVAKGYLLS